MLWQLVGMLAVVLGIGASIALHEVGHLTPAKRFGVRVPEYAIGFGPQLLSRTVGETRYSLRAIPVGGFIRMIGMYPPARSPRTGGPLVRMAEEARVDSLAEVGPDDVGRTFYEQPVHRRIIIMLGGPTMNLVLAGLLFAAALVGVGLPNATSTIDSVAPCAVSTTNPKGLPSASGTCVGGPSAAHVAGLQSGMQIVAVDGTPVQDAASLDAALAAVAKRGATDGRVTVVDASGARRTLSIHFQLLTLPTLDASGAATGATERRAVMGVLLAWQREHLPVTVVPRVMWSMTTSAVSALGAFPGKLVTLAHTLVSGGQRDPNGPVSVVGATRIGGEIAASSADGWDKVVSLLMLLGSLNLFLFLFNLLPLLPLDGGHVAAAGWEVLRNALCRRAARRPIDTARLLPLTYAMSVLLIGVGALVIWADIVKPISLGG